MAQSLKTIKNRIRSIQNTEKVTNAMQMVSASKLNRIDNLLFTIRPYFKKLESLFYNLAQNRQSAGAFVSPYLRESPVQGNVVLCLLTSDNGLCGAYNNNIIHLGQDFIRNRDGKVKLVIIGKKGFKYFGNRGYDVLHSYIGINGKFSEKICDEITGYLTNLFLSSQADEIFLGFTHFQTALVLKPTIIKFLNIESKQGEDIDYLFEPNPQKILEEIVPRYISFKLRLVLLEAFTSEHAARTVAMKSATENAKELLHKLILLRNKVRQANITRDILEIISSAEALKG